MSEFFAGTNTEVGFTGYLEEYFSPLKKVYIIKGTAGSGKSTLLKRLFSGAAEKGYEVHRIRCSSDPSSLDGIILPERGVAVADGTAPHVLEPRHPMVREFLVDVGRFMDESKLCRENILLAAKEKSTHFTRAYGYIKSAVFAERNRASLLSEGLDIQKLYSFANRFYVKNLRGERGNIQYRVANAFTGKGIQVCNPFPKAKRTLFLNGCRGCESVFLDMVKDIALSENQKITLCPHPTDSKRINGIYFHGREAYLTANKQEEGESVNLSRFFIKGYFSSSRTLLKDSGVLVKTAYALAEKELSYASHFHGLLEQNYIPAMDFSMLEGEYIRLLKAVTE